VLRNLAFPQQQEIEMTNSNSALPLTTGQRDALLRLQRGRWNRVAGGYICPGQPRITLATAWALEKRGLARSGITHGQHRLGPTAAGATLAETLTAEVA